MFALDGESALYYMQYAAAFDSIRFREASNDVDLAKTAISCLDGNTNGLAKPK